MNYHKLSLDLARYGRDTGFAYVSDSYRRDLRQSAKYRQWQRLSRQVDLKAMDPQLRRLLNGAATLRVVSSLVDRCSHPLDEIPFVANLRAAA